MGLPIYLHKYFWDINPKKATPKSHPEYYIKRVLELGDQRAVAWARRVFGSKKIASVARKANISPKSKTFWQTIFG